MAEPYDSSVAFTKKRIDDIRAKIVQLKDAINVHVGEGGNLHPVATSSSNGFMYSEDYKILNTELETWYQKILAAMAHSNIPSGTTCWYYGDPDDLPPGWHLTSSNSLNALYKITTQTNGGSVKGVVSKTENPGTEESISGKESVGNKINTIALYSIRKD